MGFAKFMRVCFMGRLFVNDRKQIDADAFWGT